jgi:hypothetical protein
MLLLLLQLLLPLPLSGSVRLGGTTHSSSTAGIAGLWQLVLRRPPALLVCY